jgi:amino acid transporter
VTAAGVTAQAPDRLFVRNATGLVRGWSSWDAFRYAFFAVNPAVLGFYTWSLAPFIANGSLVWGSIISMAFLAFAVLVYAALIAIIPRAGADYVYQSRILHGAVGFVLAAAGFWFIMCHWGPIYAFNVNTQLLSPLSATLGFDGLLNFWTTKSGIFVASLITVGIAAVLVSMGMRAYARIQVLVFWIGMLSLVVFCAILLFHSKSDFISAFNQNATKYYGAGPDAYQATMKAGGYDAPGLNMPLKDTILLIPMLLFWNIWIMWGAALSGEVRGANDYRKNVISMGTALVVALGLSLVFFALIAKTFGWQWYNAANNAYWGGVYGYVKDVPLSAWPYPVMFAGWLVHPVVQVLLIIGVGLFLVGYIGTLFLTSTRMIFAAAFDRILPEKAAYVSPRYGVPGVALVLMIVPSIVLSAMYAYWSKFATYTLDAVAVLAITFTGTAIAATVMPWTARKLFESSPFAAWRVGPIPVTTIFGAVLSAFLLFNVVLWFKDAVYGVNNKQSLVYMGILWALAALIYAIAWVYRRHQGMSLDYVQREIPTD